MSYEYHKEQLFKSEARLKDLKEKGVHALYKDEDITPSAIGEQNTALEMAKDSTISRIKQINENIAEHEAKGIQEELF